MVRKKNLIWGARKNKSARNHAEVNEFIFKLTLDVFKFLMQEKVFDAKKSF